MKKIFKNQSRLVFLVLCFVWIYSGEVQSQAGNSSTKTLIPLTDANAAELGFDISMLKKGINWKNRIENPRTITKITFSRNLDGGVMIRAWGACQPNDCDWGESPVLVSGEGKSATLVILWDHGFSEVLQELSIRGRGIRIESSTVFTDDSKRKDYSYTVEFVKN